MFSRLRRSRTIVAAGAAIVAAAALLGLWIIVAVHRDPGYSAHADVALTTLETDYGRELTAQFDALGQEPLTVSTGNSAFMRLNWSTKRSPTIDCQTQLAVHSPSEWRLVGWAGEPPIANATINSWQTVAKHDPRLQSTQATIALPPSPAGTLMLVWSVPASERWATAEDVFKAYIVYACGDADRSASVHEVSVQ